jgi:hypothetical protein
MANPNDWKSRLEAAKVARDAAKAAITDDDREEIDARAELAAIEAEKREAEKAKREVDLARRFDVARDELGESALIAPVSIDGRDDTFVIQADPKAHAKWERELTEAGQNKKLDKTEVGRNYAVAVVIDWNGVTDFSATSLNGHALIEYLKKNPGMVTPLVNAAARLAGFFAEERKS